MNNPRQPLPKRRSLRLPGYNYRSSGAYFVTICTAKMRPLFGSVRDGSVKLSELGRIADNCWRQIERIRSGIELDAYIVMPNHIHGILLFSAEESPKAAAGLAVGSLGAILGQYKSAVTKKSQHLPTPPQRPIWQRNYYDKIIRSEQSLYEIRRYIVDNPARWIDDDLFVE